MSALIALARKHWFQSANAWHVIRAQPPIKVVFILGFAAFFEFALLVLFLDGFRFLDSMAGAGSFLINRLFSLFFLGMGMMLTVSSIATTYATFFRSDEVAFLLTKPVRTSNLVLYKFWESSGLSSWAFFFIVVPFIAAYTWHEKMSPMFPVWTLVFSIPFLVLCCSLGSLVTVLVVRIMPARVPAWVPGSVLVAAIGGMLWFIRLQVPEMGDDLQLNLRRLVPGLSLASNPLVPSWWLSEGISSVVGHQWLRGGMFMVCLSASAAVSVAAMEWAGGAVFFNAWLKASGVGTRKSSGPSLFNLLERAARAWPHDIRAIVLKDIRTFFRDPMQWSQAFIFFGLLALYFANVRSFKYHLLPESWRNTIAFLNIFSVSSVVCSLGSRFIYPQLSLEGQGFWLLGLSPTTMRRILAAKFLLALIPMTLISVVLMQLSSSMLKAEPLVRIVASTMAAGISIAVCGLSTGLGAVFLDIKQRNPAAIVSGFGGTLNLILGLAVMVGTILPFGIVFHLRTTRAISPTEAAWYIAFSMGWMILVVLLATVVPLRLAVRSLGRREF